MHLAALNLSDLMISLWRGTMDCTCPDDKANWLWFVLQGNVWQKHGKAVVDTLYYLPSSFERPPCNIAEKITSGYKAWEFLMYLYCYDHGSEDLFFLLLRTAPPTQPHQHYPDSQ